jgi:uncharacterized phage-associated protein
MTFSVAPEEWRKMMNQVFSIYNRHSAWALRNLTHEEAPWQEAASGAEITHDAMQRYFSQEENDYQVL